MASLSQALRLGDLPPPHRTFQGHATHVREWSMMLRPNDSWSTCIPQGIATFLHYASRRSAGLRYTTLMHPDRREVIPLMPEPIVKHDGSEKNDGERHAATRFIAKVRQDHPHLGFIVTE